MTTLARSNITTQGLLTATSTSTNVAIQGNGFFPVTTSLTGGQTLYTRNGAFTTDNSGYLVNNGAYLLGWRTDAAGNVLGGASRRQHGADRYQRRTDQRQRDNDDNVLGQPAGRCGGRRHVHDVDVGVRFAGNVEFDPGDLGKDGG